MADAPPGLAPDERLVWLLGDLMNAAENYFGAENPKREGHIYHAAIRIMDEVIAPHLTAERAKAAAFRSALENHAVERDIECVEPYECALCLGTGASRETVKHADYCTLATTSGADLAAAIEAVLAWDAAKPATVETRNADFMRLAGLLDALLRVWRSATAAGGGGA